MRDQKLLWFATMAMLLGIGIALFGSPLDWFSDVQTIETPSMRADRVKK